jgi:hypothetical protein
MFSFTGKQIRIDSIDVFWRKLDFKPAKSKVEDIDFHAEFENIRKNLWENIESKPTQTKLSYFQKLKQIVTPSSNTKKPPVVQKNTRGRPTLKEQEQRREEAARKSSYVPSEQSDFLAPYDLPRHSSYVSSQVSQRPSSSAKPVTAGKKRPSGFSIIEPGPKSFLAAEKWGPQIPEIFHPYITKIKNAKPDGHCGFRSVAMGLGLVQKDYMQIRSEMLSEMRMKEDFWRGFYNLEDGSQYKAIYERIRFEGVGQAPVEKYMDMPDMGFLIAQIYGVIVHSISMAGCCTIFPLKGGPDGAMQPHLVVAVVFVDKAHFIHIKLQGSYPMPPPHPYWNLRRADDAEGWYHLFRPQIEAYERLTCKRPDLNLPPDVVDLC